ncbi:MAG: hypothetical protein SFV32_12845 [Opitutaceae bacterium]|nr:hypothetical protein [Opitutaceae bacterium]
MKEWWSIIISIFGIGITFGVMQARTNDNDSELKALKTEVKAEISRTNELIQQKVDALKTRDDSIIETFQKYRSEDEKSRTQIAILTVKMEEMNNQLTRLTAAVEKLPEQFNRPRDR